MSNEQNHSENLKNKQKGHRLRSVTKNVKDAAQTLALLSYLNPFIDWLFGIALTLAVLKDILDFTGIGSFPVIGTAITLAVSLSIAGIMFITGSASKIKIIKSGKKFIVLIGGTFIEMIFGIDFAPVETMMVIYIFYATLQERRVAAEEKKNYQEDATPAAA
jgi:uncharacterized membrane protein